MLSSEIDPSSANTAPTDTKSDAVSRGPNCLYIGTSKAGSTWIFDLLSRHPDIFAASGKGLYFFDSHFDNGWDWYLSHFEGAGDRPISLEISHSYLYSAEACQRIAAYRSAMKLLVCVREPVSRTFSDYLDHVKNGRYQGTFAEAIEQLPSIVDRSRYATHLRPYWETFGSNQVHVGVFDDLSERPQQFADELFDFLGIARMPLRAGQLVKMMPAGKPRSQSVMTFTKYLSKRLKQLGFRALMGRIKRSRRVRDVLYQAYTDRDKPKPTAEEAAKLRALFKPEVEELDRMLGTQLIARWGYDHC
jgi:hypothetical protein